MSKLTLKQYIASMQKRVGEIERDLPNHRDTMFARLDERKATYEDVIRDLQEYVEDTDQDSHWMDAESEWGT